MRSSSVFFGISFRCIDREIAPKGLFLAMCHRGSGPALNPCINSASPGGLSKGLCSRVL